MYVVQDRLGATISTEFHIGQAPLILYRVPDRLDATHSVQGSKKVRRHSFCTEFRIGYTPTLVYKWWRLTPICTISRYRHHSFCIEFQIGQAPLILYRVPRRLGAHFVQSSRQVRRHHLLYSVPDIGTTPSVYSFRQVRRHSFCTEFQ